MAPRWQRAQTAVCNVTRQDSPNECLWDDDLRIVLPVVDEKMNVVSATTKNVTGTARQECNEKGMAEAKILLLDERVWCE